MMYLSQLLINVGDNPDRPRPGRLWLRNHYHVHQRLCMAFPSAERKTGDTNFIKMKRQVNGGFLFRVDPLPGGRAMIIVQSAVEPDWEYAFHNAEYFMAAPPQWKPYNPSFTHGQRLRFRLLANPTRCLRSKSIGPDGNQIREEYIGKRVPVPAGKMIEWLIDRSEKAGFSIEEKAATFHQGYISIRKSREAEEIRLRAVRYEGMLNVVDASIFRDIIISGIGRGKAFGFGLLSVCRLEQ